MKNKDIFDGKRTDILTDLFKRIPEKEPSASFRSEIMRKIAYEAALREKRSERLGLLAIVTASLAMITLAVLSFAYLEIPAIPQPDLSQVSVPHLRFYLHIGGIALFLLFLDHGARKRFLKDRNT